MENGGRGLDGLVFKRGGVAYRLVGVVPLLVVVVSFTSVERA